MKITAFEKLFVNRTGHARTVAARGARSRRRVLYR